MSISGQSPRPKVLRWPNRQVVVGYVGLGKVAGKYTDEWLYDFIGRNLDTELSLKQLADNLKRDLESDLSGQIGSTPSRDDALILHLGGFVEEDAGQWKPQVWFIRNARAMDAFGYTDIAAEFLPPSDEIPPYFQGITATKSEPMSTNGLRIGSRSGFTRAIDLATFNALDQVLRAGMRAIVENHPNRPHQFPDSLQEWSKHLKMAILTYGAYFGAFYQPFQQYVGGGADVVWADWP